METMEHKPMMKSSSKDNEIIPTKKMSFIEKLVTRYKCCLVNWIILTFCSKGKSKYSLYECFEPHKKHKLRC